MYRKRPPRLLSHITSRPSSPRDGYDRWPYRRLPFRQPLLCRRSPKRLRLRLRLPHSWPYCGCSLVAAPPVWKRKSPRDNRADGKRPNGIAAIRRVVAPGGNFWREFSRVLAIANRGGESGKRATTPSRRPPVTLRASTRASAPDARALHFGAAASAAFLARADRSSGVMVSASCGPCARLKTV